MNSRSSIHDQPHHDLAALAAYSLILLAEGEVPDLEYRPELDYSTGTPIYDALVVADGQRQVLDAARRAIAEAGRAS